MYRKQIMLVKAVTRKLLPFWLMFRNCCTMSIRSFSFLNSRASCSLDRVIRKLDTDSDKEGSFSSRIWMSLRIPEMLDLWKALFTATPMVSVLLMTSRLLIQAFISPSKSSNFTFWVSKAQTLLMSVRKFLLKDSL